MDEMNDIKVKSEKKTLKTRRWCSVPHCDFKGDCALFHFPVKNKKLCNKWVMKCRIGKKVTRNMYVCASHFNNFDFHPRPLGYEQQHKVFLKANAVPSCNLPKRSTAKVLTEKQLKNNLERAERAKRRIKRFEEICEVPIVPNLMELEEKNFIQNESVNDTDVFENAENLPLENLINESQVLVDNCEECDEENFDANYNNNTPLDRSSEALEAAEALLELQNVAFEMKEPSESNVISSKNEEISELISNKTKFTLCGLLRNDDDLNIFTGINFLLLNNLTEAFKLCVKKCVYYHSLNVTQRIILSLCKLKLNLSYKCLAVLFGITRKTCSLIIINTLQTLAYILKNAIYWPSKEEILCSMPICFKKFKNTCGVMDCSEIALEKSKCLNCRLRTYSHYKGGETMKFLFVVSPSGLIMRISEPFGGRASDKAIFNHTDILKKFEPTRDAVMVDKGFSIEEECALSRVKLIIPPKLSSNKQFSKENCIMTQEVASARVHVERTIQRVKLFKIMSSKITCQIAPYMSEISKVVCGLVNLSASIIDDDGYPNTQNAPRVKNKKRRKNKLRLR